MIDIKKAVRAAIESDKARITLYSSASIAALYALTSATPVFAADAGAKGGDELEEIVVSGYRKSLQTAQDIKRESDVMVDSVTAADIGSLPDRSVSETLQRIPGVSINRFAAGVDPDHFSVEGSGVTVRGLTYVHSEFNGRDTFTANNGRELSFADVPSELLNGVDVFKSPSADRIEGGIGGVVNLRTRVPFDAKGFVAAGSLETSYGDFAKKYTPAGSVLLSDRWNTDMGEFGLLGDVSYSELKSRADKEQVSNFFHRGLNPNGNLDYVPPDPGTLPAGDQLVYVPRGAVGGTQVFDRTRRGIAAAFQWRSPDDKWEALAQFIKSDARESWSEHTIEIATDNVAGGSTPELNGTADSMPVPNTAYTFDNNGLFTSGMLTGSSTGWRADQYATWRSPEAAPGQINRTPINALQSNQYNRAVEQKYVTEDMSAHVKWTPTDATQIDFDYQHVNSSVDDLDVEQDMSEYQDMQIQLKGPGGDQIPYVMFLPPSVCLSGCGNPGDNTFISYFGPGHQSFIDPYNAFPRAAMDHIEASTGYEDAGRLDATFALADNSWIKSIKAGYRYARRDNLARFSTYNWGVLSEQWGGTNGSPGGNPNNGGPVWLDSPVAGNNGMPLTNSYVAYNFDNFMKGATPSPLGTEGRLFWNGNPARDYGALIAWSTAINQTWEAPNADGTNQGWNPLGARPNVIPGTPFLPGEVNEVIESNNAFYLMANLSHDISNGWKLTGNVGVRYTRTHRDAPGNIQYGPLTGVPSDGDCTNDQNSINGGNHAKLPPFCQLSVPERATVRSYYQYEAVPTEDSITYSYALPSINLKLDVGHGLQYRFDYFKGVAPPDFGLTRNFYNVNGATALLTYDSGGNLLNASAYATASSGTTRLKPVEADNFDFSVEWYFSNVGQLTAAVFYKSLKNVITNNTVRLNPGDPLPSDVNPLAANITSHNGVSLPVVLSYPANSPDTGKVKGIEFGYQQTFDFLPGWLNGFGVSANYTYVSSSGVRQTTLSATDPDVAAGKASTVDTSKLPLQGLSKNQFNITPFYQKGIFEARLAYNWRSEFLLTPRDVIVPYQPILNEATGTLDGSLFFTITPHFKVGLQGANLTNEVTKTRAVISDDLKTAPRGFYVSDRRYTLGLRWTFD